MRLLLLFFGLKNISFVCSIVKGMVDYRRFLMPRALLALPITMKYKIVQTMRFRS